MQEVEHEERQTQHASWLEEKVDSLEKEKEEMKVHIQEMGAKMALQENAMKEVVDRHLRVEAAISQIAEHI